jgi:HSP20 family protein
MSSKEKKELQVAPKKEIESAGGEPTKNGIYFTPHVDIYETDDAIEVVADMPGVSTGDLDIDLREGVLTITGTVKSPYDGMSPIYREYDVGGFARRFQVGEAIDQAKITANLECGVLTLTLPKAEKLKPRKITVSG